MLMSFRILLLVYIVCLPTIIYSSITSYDVQTSPNIDVLSTFKPPTSIEELPTSVIFPFNTILELNCNINGNPRPNYQWHASKNYMTENWEDQNFVKIPNANNYTLTIDENMIMGSHLYYCSAQNSLGSLNSNRMVVKKVHIPSSKSVSYLFHPVNEGEKFVAQCYMTDDPVPLYSFKHWEVVLKSDMSLFLKKTVGRYSVIDLTKYPQLHIRNVTDEDFRSIRIRCVFQSRIDNGKDVVNGEFKKIKKPTYTRFSYGLCYKLEVLTAALGSNVELPWCSVPDTLEVSWYKTSNYYPKKEVQVGHKVNDTKFSTISGRYGNLLITNVTKEDAGDYSAVVTMRGLRTTFTLNVYETPSIDMFPRDQRKKLSESAKFVCESSLMNAQFSWLHNGVKVVSGMDNNNVEVISVKNTSTLQVKYAQLSSSGVYQCILTLQDARVYMQTSGSLLLSEVPPTLLKQSPRKEKESSSAHLQMLSKNDVQTIVCVFAANPKASIEWYHDFNKIPITDVIKIIIANDSNSVYNFVTNLTIDLKEATDVMQYAGEYRASASNSLGSISCSTFVFMEGAMELRLPTSQTAIGYSDYNLTCFFKAIEVPKFAWARMVNGENAWTNMPTNHKTILVDAGHKLLIKNAIKSEDEGEYRCTIMYDQKTMEATTRLVVANKPILRDLPTKHDRSQNQKHMCTISSVADEPWYAWWTFKQYNVKETIIISQNVSYQMFSTYHGAKLNIVEETLLPGVPAFLSNYPNLGADLTVQAGSHKENEFGIFVCHIKNHAGYNMKMIRDNFLILEFDLFPIDQDVVVGSDLHLNCTTKKSDLEPVIRWQLGKDNIYIDISNAPEELRSRIVQYANGTLVIKHFKEFDPPRFMCMISQTGPINRIESKKAYIEVKVPARIDAFDKEIIKLSGSTFNISCNVYGNSNNMSIRWYYRSSSIVKWTSLHSVVCNHSEEFHCVSQYQSKFGQFSAINENHNKTFHTVHLEYRDAKESISGQYKCEAKNRFNVDLYRARVSVTIISRPSHVIMDSIQNTSTATSVGFHWKSPESFGNRPILRYIVHQYEMSSLGAEGERRNATRKTVVVNSTVHSIVLQPLRPYKKYEINVAAENEVGVGEAVTIYLETQEAKPQKSVNYLVAVSEKPSEIRISWRDPDIEYQNGHISQYQVCYQIIPTAEIMITLDTLIWPDSSLQGNQDSRAKCELTRVKSITVPDLPQFTDFAIRVIAFNSKGASPALFTKVRTLEDLPQAPPTQVMCQGQNEAIELSWNPPGRNTINGVLMGYAIYYYHPNLYQDESGMRSTNVHGRTSALISQLKPYTLYSIQIMAINRKGLGPPSDSVLCSTKEAKAEPPEMVKAVKINNTCTAISWLKTPNPNGKILEYCVVGFNEGKMKCQPFNMNKRYSYMVLCDSQEILSSVEVFARSHIDGARKEQSLIEEGNCIISIGGQIEVDEGSSVILHCEVWSKNYKNIRWKKDDHEFKNHEYPNVTILGNFSLEIKHIEKFGGHQYSCTTDCDTIKYNLNVKESSDGIPTVPIIDDTRVTENSIFVRWKSRGNSDMSAPITGYIINWTNFYTGDTKTVHVKAKVRSFYLNNVTCASNFQINLSSKSTNGNSKFSVSKQLQTLGSAPKIADSAVLLPLKNCDSQSANFNLMAFLPGENCSAMYFIIEVSLPFHGGHQFEDLFYTKNISVYELENKCCHKVTGLNPSTQYKYRVTAYNPAGPTQAINIFDTLAIVGAPPGYRQHGSSTGVFGIQSWPLMIILVIVIIFILIIVAIGVLYILRSKEKKSHNFPVKPPVRKLDPVQNRYEKTGNVEDTASIDSEPSPYAVYQPDADPKVGPLWSQQLPQQSSTPLYNYTDHLYNQIRYDKIPGRQPVTSETRHDNFRRANSAECLSSVGNASITGIADLESPSNIDKDTSQDYFKAPFNHCTDTDEVFMNLRRPDFSTVNKKRVRRESENLGRHNEEESFRMLRSNGNRDAMSRSRYYEPTNSGALLPQVHSIPGNSNHHHHNYRQQMSVPEPASSYQQQYGYPSNRIRTTSGPGRSHPSSQTVLNNNHGSSAQVPSYGNHFGPRVSHITPYATSSGVRNEPANNHYSSYKPDNSLSNYNPPQRTILARSTLEPLESPDEGIYTDRVVVV